MKKYNCEYRDGHKLNIGNNWEKKGILASNHKEAYEKFIQEVGLYPKSVTVSSGLLGVWKEFDNHIEEAKANVMESASDIGVQTMDAEKLTSEQLLMNLLRGQQTQINELKKLNFKLMMFWIFLVVLPLLGWLLTQ